MLSTKTWAYVYPYAAMNETVRDSGPDSIIYDSFGKVD